MQDQDPMFEILGPIRSEKTTHLKREIKTLKDETLKDAAKFQSLYEELGEAQKLIVELEKAKDAPVNRALIQEGYVIVPCEMLDGELARDVGSEPEIIISARELIAMRASAVMEINKGDTKATSLNVKLYRGINDFVDHEIDKLIIPKQERE